MKFPHPVYLIALSLHFGCVPCLATSVGISTVEQPVNLVSHSDPTRIPLGRVGVMSNYDYGIHYKIVESRPSPQGGMKWKNGSELDQNLAAVFGISMEISDSSQILVAPVTLRLNAWKPPAYSPYTKEQVLAATIWCLIRSTGSSPERPLELKVVTESEDDKLLAGWVESKPIPSNPNYNELKCEFVWDAKTSKLTKGSIPCVTTDKKNWIQLLTPSEGE